MKILYICGTYCPSHGGAEISMHTLLKFLKRRYSAKILVLTDLRYTLNKKRYIYESIPLVGTNHKNRVENMKKVISTFNPDMIITQLMWSDKVLKIGKEMNIPTVLRVCKIPFEIDLKKDSIYSPTGIICVSKAVKEYVKKRWGRKSKILKPSIELGRKIIIPKNHIKDPYNREYILMFNPLKRKGGEIFRELAIKNPTENFAVVLGWSSLKEEVNSKTFSNKLIKRICDSQGTKFTGKKPRYADIKNIRNIKILKPEEGVWKIYSKTKILLIPSQWEEAFGRVAIEGMANKIPSLGSNVGGLKEAIGKGGIIVKDYKNVESWSRQLKRLEDKRVYNKTSSKGEKWVKKNYILDNNIKDAYFFLLDILKNSGTK